MGCTWPCPGSSFRTVLSGSTSLLCAHLSDHPPGVCVRGRASPRGGRGRVALIPEPGWRGQGNHRNLLCRWGAAEPGGPPTLHRGRSWLSRYLPPSHQTLLQGSRWAPSTPQCRSQQPPVRACGSVLGLLEQRTTDGGASTTEMCSLTAWRSESEIQVSAGLAPP